MLPASSHHLALVGAGYLGTEVARAWPGPVTATTRGGSWRGDPPPASVRLHALDLTAPLPSDPALFEAATHLVICIAAGRQQDRRAVYVEGTRQLLAWVSPPRQVPWQRVVFVSSTSALPAFDGWIDESCEAPPPDERGQVQRDAEAVVMQWCARHRIPSWILRLGGLYGPGRDLGAIYRQRNATVMPGDGHVPTNLIHREDACAAVIAALLAPEDRGGLLHAVDDDHTTRRVMYERIATARGLPSVSWSASVPPGAAPCGKRISNLRLKSQLGIRLLHPTHSSGGPCIEGSKD